MCRLNGMEKCSQCLAHRNNTINTSILKSYSFWCLFNTVKHSVFVNYNLWNQTNRSLYNIPDTFTILQYLKDLFCQTTAQVRVCCVCILSFASLNLIAIHKVSVTTIKCLLCILVASGQTKPII